MTATKFAELSNASRAQSGGSYQAPDIGSENFVPASPFKGIHVNDAAGGDITITGLDGISVTFTVSQGSWPYGGIAVISATSTVTDIVVIF